MKKKYRFSLRVKILLLTTILAVITYSFSALFIYVLYDYIQPYWAITEQNFIIIVLSLGIIWSAILAYFAAKFITKPMERLEQVASNAADGHLNQSIVFSKSDDEIRALSISFDAMLKNLQGMVHNIDEHFEYTNDSVKQLKQAAHEATTYSQQIGSSIEEISQGAEGSSDAVQQTVHSVETVTQLAQEVEAKADQSKKKSNTMLDSLNTSKQAIDQLVNGFKRVTSDQEASLQDVEHLKENAQQVESIITMVGDISEQTNLLALNASIEAARAGEHGKGFAVVAEEIRKLADQSATAVKRISDLINLIQEDVGAVVQKINTNVNDATEETKTSNEKTTHAIKDMTNSINDVVAEIDAITGAVRKQRESIESTSNQSQEVAAIAEETSAGAEEVNASVQDQTSIIENIENMAGHLEEQAKTLNEQIRKFDVS